MIPDHGSHRREIPQWFHDKCLHDLLGGEEILSEFQGNSLAIYHLKKRKYYFPSDRVSW